MAECMTAVTPVLMHWSYCSPALSHQYIAQVIEVISCGKQGPMHPTWQPRIPGNQQPWCWPSFHFQFNEISDTVITTNFCVWQLYFHVMCKIYRICNNKKWNDNKIFSSQVWILSMNLFLKWFLVEHGPHFTKVGSQWSNRQKVSIRSLMARCWLGDRPFLNQHWQRLLMLCGVTRPEEVIDGLLQDWSFLKIPSSCSWLCMCRLWKLISF